MLDSQVKLQIMDIAKEQSIEMSGHSFDEWLTNLEKFYKALYNIVEYEPNSIVLDSQVKLQIIDIAKEQSMGAMILADKLTKFQKVYNALCDIVEYEPPRNGHQSDSVSYQD